MYSFISSLCLSLHHFVLIEMCLKYNHKQNVIQLYIYTIILYYYAIIMLGVCVVVKLSYTVITKQYISVVITLFELDQVSFCLC